MTLYRNGDPQLTYDLYTSSPPQGRGLCDVHSVSGDPQHTYDMYDLQSTSVGGGYVTFIQYLETSQHTYDLYDLQSTTGGGGCVMFIQYLDTDRTPTICKTSSLQQGRGLCDVHPVSGHPQLTYDLYDL